MLKDSKEEPLFNKNQVISHTPSSTGSKAHLGPLGFGFLALKLLELLLVLQVDEQLDDRHDEQADQSHSRDGAPHDGVKVG